MTDIQSTYLQDPSKCPHCGSYDILADGEASACNRRFTQHISCTSCDESWLDIYTLTSIETIEEDDDDDVHGDIHEHEQPATDVPN